MNPIKKAWRWFTLKDLHTEALDKMLPAGHNAWISVFKEDGAESYFSVLWRASYAWARVVSARFE